MVVGRSFCVRGLTCSSRLLVLPSREIRGTGLGALQGLILLLGAQVGDVQSLFYSWHCAVVCGVETRGSGVKKPSYLGVTLRVDASLACDLRCLFPVRRPAMPVIVGPPTTIKERQRERKTSAARMKKTPTVHPAPLRLVGIARPYSSSSMASSGADVYYSISSPGRLLGAGGWFFRRRGRASLPPRGGWPPPLCVSAGLLLPRAGISLGMWAALGHGVSAPVALLYLAPLDGALMVCRLVLLRTPSTCCGGP